MARDYVTQFEQHLPSGAAWPRHSESVAAEVHRGLTAEFARIDERAAQLLLEMDPRTTTELIEDWERITGLPDPCVDAAPTTIEGRRAAVVARLISRGSTSGPGVEFLKDAIVALGYARDDIIIRRFHLPPFTCESACTDALNPDSAGWRDVWEIIVRHGALDATLACQLVERFALAHLDLQDDEHFAFPLFFFADGTVSRAGGGVLTNPETGEQTALGPDELGTFYFGV